MDLGECTIPYILSLGIKMKTRELREVFFLKLCTVNLDRMTLEIFHNFKDYTCIFSILYYYSHSNEGKKLYFRNA